MVAELQIIYFEFLLENIFYRTKSKLPLTENSNNTNTDNNKCQGKKKKRIKYEHIPVFSFRYKLAFSKTEEDHFKDQITKYKSITKLLIEISGYLIES